jgi:hypothetical protein
MPVIEDQITTPPAGMMPVVQVIEAQRASILCLTITSVITRSGRLRSLVGLKPCLMPVRVPPLSIRSGTHRPACRSGVRCRGR